MGYIENHLLPNEYIEHTGKTTFLYLIPKLIGMLLFIILGAYLLKDAGEEVAAVSFAFAIIEFFGLISRTVTCLTSEFVITNKRVCLKRGFISRQVSDIALDKCDGVSFSQGILGRILGFGVVETSSTGRKGQNYPALARPNEFRNHLFRIIDQYKA